MVFKQVEIVFFADLHVTFGFTCSFVRYVFLLTKICVSPNHPRSPQQTTHKEQVVNSLKTQRTWLWLHWRQLDGSWPCCYFGDGTSRGWKLVSFEDVSLAVDYIGTNPSKTHMNIRTVTSTISRIFVDTTASFWRNTFVSLKPKPWNVVYMFFGFLGGCFIISLQIIQIQNLSLEPLPGKSIETSSVFFSPSTCKVDFPSGDVCWFAGVDVFFPNLPRQSPFATRCCWVIFREEPKRCFFRCTVHVSRLPKTSPTELDVIVLYWIFGKQLQI